MKDWDVEEEQNENEKKRKELLERLTPAQRLRRFKSWYKKKITDRGGREALYWPSERLGTLARPNTREYKRMKQEGHNMAYINAVYGIA